MATSTSIEVAKKYQSLGRANTNLQLKIKFEQDKFIETNRKWMQSLSDNLHKPLLEDHRAEKAAEGICAAAVMQWLATGLVPPSTQDMFTTLSSVQGSFDVDTERDYLTWHSNLSKAFQGLTKVKDSGVLNLIDTQKFINYLLDNTGNIETKYKLFLILIFQNNNAHAVGLNLKTRSFFDPNYGVWEIQSSKDAFENIAYSVIGLDQIRSLYQKQKVVTVVAITYV